VLQVQNLKSFPVPLSISGAPKETANKIAETFSDALTIVVERLACMNSYGLCRGKRFEQAKKGNRHGTGEELGHPLKIDFRDVERGQRGRNRPIYRNDRLVVLRNCGKA
jgi:hypothetical protein